MTLIAFAVIWALTVAFGLSEIHKYSTTASVGSSPPVIWPASSSLLRRPNSVTVVMLAHPQCPCTRASLGELAIAAAQTASRLDIHVVFLATPAFDVESDLWGSAHNIPNTTVLADADGLEISKFRVNASGHILAYGPNGRLLFSGGIVGARGHAGANPGREALVELARTGNSPVETTPVFGCALQKRQPLAGER